MRAIRQRLIVAALWSAWCSTALANEVREIPPPPPNYATPTVVPAEPTQTATPSQPATPPPSTPLTPQTFPDVQAQTTPRGHHTHDGFFFRGSLGIASTSAVEQDAGQKLRIGGWGAPVTFAFGSTLRDMNLALYGEFQGTSISDPRIRVNGETHDHVDRMFVGSLGFGASYYLMPLNVYFAGTLGFGSVDLYRSSRSTKPAGSTGTGLSLRASVGKEWWVSDEWGIGAAAHVLLMSLPDSGASTLTVLSAGISASATYN